MKAAFNIMPYKFWVHGISDGTYLFVTDSDKRAEEFMAANEHSCDMPPYICGDGLDGDSYATRIHDWYLWGGKVVLNVSEVGDDEDLLDYVDYLTEMQGRFLECIMHDESGITMTVRKDVNPRDFFDLLYDLYDYEVEEFHCEDEAA